MTEARPNINHIFDYDDYKDVIRGYLASHQNERGYQGRLAKAAGCGPSFFSQALGSHIHLTPDQAAGLADFWQLQEDEAEYFLCLVHHARSGSHAFKKMQIRKIQALKQKHQSIAERVQAKIVPLGEKEMIYYSAWYWSAIHMSCTIPEFQTSAAIARRLRLDNVFVETCLRQLRDMQLVQEQNGRWRNTNADIHLPRESPMVGVLHSNWRQKAAAQAQMQDREALHYSAVQTLSRADYQKLKNLLLEFVQESRKIAAPSKEEEIIAVCLDCFRL
jgi:uncharacterized protein (TIGR02147 family)